MLQICRTCITLHPTLLVHGGWFHYSLYSRLLSCGLLYYSLCFLLPVCALVSSFGCMQRVGLQPLAHQRGSNSCTYHVPLAPTYLYLLIQLLVHFTCQSLSCLPCSLFCQCVQVEPTSARICFGCFADVAIQPLSLPTYPLSLVRNRQVPQITSSPSTSC